MRRLIFITGGARSGKSNFAEQLLANEKNVLYVATATETDEEMKQRIKKHKATRPHNWSLLEKYKNFQASDFKDHEAILIECLPTMITNLLYELEQDFNQVIDEKKAENIIIHEITLLVSACKKATRKIIIVSNEIGCGLVPETQFLRFFRDTLGRMNQKIAQLSDEVYFVVSGCPCKVK